MRPRSCRARLAWARRWITSLLDGGSLGYGCAPVHAGYWFIYDDTGKYTEIDTGEYTDNDAGKCTDTDSGKYTNMDMDSGKYTNMHSGKYAGMDSGKYTDILAAPSRY